MANDVEKLFILYTRCDLFSSLYPKFYIKFLDCPWQQFPIDQYNPAARRRLNALSTIMSLPRWRHRRQIQAQLGNEILPPIYDGMKSTLTNQNMGISYIPWDNKYLYIYTHATYVYIYIFAIHIYIYVIIYIYDLWYKYVVYIYNL